MISVIVPVYNVEPYLRRCVDSLLVQSIGDMEIILVDDGSTDNSPAICDEYARKDCRVKVVHKKNEGLSAARNDALKIAKGEYVGFVDSDDWVEPEMFETLISNIVKYNAQLSVCALKADYDDGKTLLLKTDDVYVLNYAQLMDAFLCDVSVLGYACNKLFVTKRAKETRFDETLFSSEDIDFCVRYAAKINTAVATPAQLYHYRQRRGSMTGEFAYSFRKLSVLQAYENILPVYRSKVPEKAYIVEKYLLKQHLNVLGRMSISGIQDSWLKQRLLTRAGTLWNPVMSEKRNSISEKANILITRGFPATMLRVKQWFIKRRYK